MAQKIQTYTTKRSFEAHSIDRFIFSKSIAIPIALWFRSLHSFIILLILLFGISSCGEPEIRLTRADRKTIDTLVNNQLDSISPILDSLCFEETEMIIKRAVDSIVKERQKQEERLRLNTEGN